MRKVLLSAIVLLLGCGGAATQQVDETPLSALARADRLVAEARAKDAQAAALLNEAERVKREAEEKKATARSGVLGALGGKLAVAEAAMRQLAQEKAAAKAELDAESAAVRRRFEEARDRRQQADQQADGGSRGDHHHANQPPQRRENVRPPPAPDTASDARFSPPGCESAPEGCPVLEDAPTPAVYFKVISWQSRGLRRTSRYPAADWSLRVNLETRTVRLLVGSTAVWQTSTLEVGKCYRGQATGTPRISEVLCADAASAAPPPAERPAPILAPAPENRARGRR